MTLVPLAHVDGAAVEGLLDRAFGADRRGRTAYRIRAGAAPIDALSFAALRDEESLVGTIQCWPVALTRDSGGGVPMVMVGPVAVEPELQRDGIGRVLMTRMLEAADAIPAPGHDALMLIGDPEYYGRFFGFTDARTSQWRLPGPYEKRRLLARGDAVLDVAGEVGPRVLATV